MKILSNNISIVKKLQSRLDNKYGKGILKAAMVLMLFGCMSFFTSCASTGSEARPSPIEGENQRRSNNSSSQSGPTTITIEQTGQTAQLGDEIYDTDEPHVIDAYLAQKIEEENKKENQKYITIRGNDFEPINSGEFGDEVYVIVDTINLVGKTATISILDKEGILVKGKMDRVAFKGSKDGKYSEKIGDDDYALFKIDLKPNKESDENIWKKKCKTKKVLLAIQIDVDDAENVIYCGKNNEQDDKANIWLNKDGSWFVVKYEMGVAPWMEIAWKEHKYWSNNGLTESNGDGLKRAQEYVNSTDENFAPNKAAWCGCFIHWVLMKTNEYTNQIIGDPDFSTVVNNPSGSLNYDEKSRYPDRKLIDPTLDNPPYGVIVVLQKGSAWEGHVGFLINYKKVNDIQYAYLLGGNQNDKVCVQEFEVLKENKTIYYKTKKGTKYTLKRFVYPKQYNLSVLGTKAYKYKTEGYEIEEVLSVV